MARPDSREAKARTSQFLCAIAGGGDAVEAAKQAKLDPWRALKIVTESDFNDVLQAIRDGLTQVAVVELVHLSGCDGSDCGCEAQAA